MTVNGRISPMGELLFLALPFVSYPGRAEAARQWVDAARKSGLKPLLVQQPLSSEEAGEWLIRTSKADCGQIAGPGALPEELWDEVFMLLAASGDFVHQEALKCWHGAVLLDDGSDRAILTRLRLVQQRIRSDGCCIFAKAASEGYSLDNGANYSAESLKWLCDSFGIPESWLTSGEPGEIELTVE
jgi:hypothetical protein